MERQRGQSAELPQISESPYLPGSGSGPPDVSVRSEGAQHVGMQPAATGTDVIFALGRKRVWESLFCAKVKVDSPAASLLRY